MDKRVQLSTVCRGIVFGAKGASFRVVRVLFKEVSMNVLAVLPLPKKGNKSEALQMGVLPSCNVSNPQGFWMVASFFES